MVGGLFLYGCDHHSCYGDHSHTKIAPLVTKITYIKMDSLRSIRNGFANGPPAHSHFYAAWIPAIRPAARWRLAKRACWLVGRARASSQSQNSGSCIAKGDKLVVVMSRGAGPARFSRTLPSGPLGPPVPRGPSWLERRRKLVCCECRLSVTAFRSISACHNVFPK